MKHTCPHCGNTDPKYIEDNGTKPSRSFFTLLCVARVRREDAAPHVQEHAPADVDGKVACGWQWEPNAE